MTKVRKKVAGVDKIPPEGLASMTYRVIGARPWSPLVQCKVSAVPYREIKGSPGGPGAPSQAKKKKYQLAKNAYCDFWGCLNDCDQSPTFSRPRGDVGLHLGPVRERFGPDAEVVGDAVGQVLDLHPQGCAALHIYSHYLTDTWSARRGVCTGNTKSLDDRFPQEATRSKALTVDFC